MSMRLKLFCGVSLLGLLVLVGIVAFMSQQALHVIENNERSELELIGSVIETKLAEQIEATRAITLSVANNREIQRLFSERNREQLTDDLLPAYEAVSDRFAQMQFHLPDSTSFLRLHQPSKFGDSLKDFRYTVNECNRTKTVTAGLEEGRGGYGLRVVAPMFHNGRHIGSVEFGGNFGSAFAQTLKDDLGGEYFIYQLQDTSVAWDEHEADDSGLLVATCESDLWPVASDLLPAVLGGNQQQYLSTDKHDLILLLPLRDFQQKVIGYIKMVRDREKVLASTAKTRRNAYLLSISAALVIALVLYILQGRLLKPLTDLVIAAQAMGAGDFTVSLSHNDKDEIGQISAAFAELRDRVGATINQIAEASTSLTQASQSLSASTEETAAAIQQVAGTSSQFAQGVERLTDEATRMNEDAASIAEYATHGSSAIQQVVDSSEALSAKIAGITQAVGELGGSSQEIGNIVRVMADIAEQTNLLALNAAIEAARAGEHGRGFAVVAEEVSKLAEQSSRSASEITSLIQAIQKAADRAVSDMGEGAQAAQMSAQVAKENGEIIHQIIENVEQVAHRVRDMSAGLQDMGSSSQQIAALTQEQSAVIGNVASATGQLNAMADELEELVKWFKLA
ncbi:MAG: methyl-accepting chemotaxis protein [Firmicutes bacterium]|nr:methyl-accepting chemotaxis protein [Bacillota bacterium]